MTNDANYLPTTYIISWLKPSYKFLIIQPSSLYTQATAHKYNKEIYRYWGKKILLCHMMHNKNNII